MKRSRPPFRRIYEIVQKEHPDLFINDIDALSLVRLGAEINRKQTETPVARLSFSPLIQKTFTVSPDSRRIAYIDQAVGKQCVVIDGLSQSCYDEVLTRPLFSPDSKRIAYVARKGAGKFIVVDGKEQKPCNDIVGYPRFSPDSKKVAFVARSGGGECVVIDGAEGEKFDEIGRTGIRNGKVVFSPDGKRIAYVARSGDSQFVVADGVKQKEYEIVGSNALCSWGIPVFSPDGKRLGYQAMSGKWLAVIDGTEGKNYDEVSFIIFSPDSSRTGYLASRGKKRFAVIDGIESKGYDAVDLLSFSYMMRFSCFQEVREFSSLSTIILIILASEIK